MGELERVQRFYGQIAELSPETAESLAYLYARSEVGARASVSTDRKLLTIM